ncbi:MAG: copper amine oxidase [Selenomonadaceae bacterium]|nr:copper amine oxidase [Selenomonadaceae bacterium]
MNFAGKLIAAAMAFIASVSSAFPAIAAKNDRNFTSNVMNRLPVDVMDTGGTLIFSDSPEYVHRNGILYTDTVSGDARILFYHLNDTGVRKKLAVIVENTSHEENKIEITRGGFSSPGKNFMSVGKATQLMYMQNDFHDTLKLKGGERKLFQAEMDNVVINPGNLVYGVYDFHATRPVKVFVLMYPQTADPIAFLNIAEILPKDSQRLRGTFKRMNRTLRLKREYDPKVDGIGYVLICDNATDFFRHGIDATDGSEVINYGNYGINYTLDFRTKSKTRFCLSPLGGLYAGAVRFNHGNNSGMIATPGDRIYFGDKTPQEPPHVQKAREEGISIFTNHTELSELGSYSGKVSFEYSPPGASNLPVNIVLLPEN